MALEVLCRAVYADDVELVVLSPHNSSIKFETQRAFSNWHEEKFGQPVRIRWRESGGGTSQMLRFIHSEFAQNPSGILVDVFYGGGDDPFKELAEAGHLAKFALPEDLKKRIPGDLSGMTVYDPGERWFGAAFSSFGILTNEVVRRTVDLPVVKTWEDLGRPEIQGWVSSCDPRQSGSVLKIYEIILQAYGWERGWAIISAMSGNVRSFLKSAGSTAKQASVGEVAFAIAIDIYGWMQVAYVGKTDMSFVLPEDGAVVNPDGIAILKGAPNEEIAERFVGWVLSDPGQKLWMLEKGQPGGAVKYDINRMGILPGLYTSLGKDTPVQVNPYQLKRSFHFDPALSNKRRRILAGLIGTVFVDIHASCVESWRAIIQVADKSERERLMAEFKKPYMTLDELLAVASEDWKNPVRQNEIIIQWQKQALDRYRDLQRQAERLPKKSLTASRSNP